MNTRCDERVLGDFAHCAERIVTLYINTCHVCFVTKATKHGHPGWMFRMDSLAGACEDLVGTVSFGASLETDLSEGVSFWASIEIDLSVGVSFERTCLEFLAASKGPPENIGQEPRGAELRPGVCGGAEAAIL